MNIVFVHGLFGTADDWAEVLPWFNKYNVQAITLPGHGKNPAKLKNYSIQNLSNWLYEQIKTPSHFVGYSLGGRILLNLYKDHHELFKSLILESASPGIRDQVEKETRKQNDLNIQTNSTRFFSDWYNQPLFLSLQDQPALLEKIIKNRNLEYSLELQKVLQDSSPGQNPENWKVLGSVNCGLFIAGQLDTKYSSLANSIVAQNPSFKVEIIEKAGHCVHRENPKKFALALNNFMENI